MKRIVTSALVLALLVLFTVPAIAQGSAESSVKGNLSGIVSDSTGAVVPGAKVTLSGPEGTKVDTSNADGGFLFPLLTPGTYSVRVEKGQFKTAEVKGVEVLTGKTSALRLSMQPGEASTTIIVEGNVQTVDTTTSAVSANLNDTFYSAVPVARGVTGLFYASPGVTGGGGTGAANPSISGGSGLENLYTADGVNITDGGFGGIGVFSRLYGPLATGINLSFVKEVQVKTGGFEAQYGKTTGGIVQIVTKTGGNKFSGSIGGYFAPEQFEATRLQPDDFQNGTQDQLFNLLGKVDHQSNYDLDAEIGGYVPKYKEHLFFFGSFNPAWNNYATQFAQFRNASDLGTAGLAGPTQTFLGTQDVGTRVYNYAAKLTWKLNDKHQFESSIFGDPTYGDPNPNGGLNVADANTFDKLEYGTRNFVGRYNGVLTPTWLANASFSWGHNSLTDTPQAPDTYAIIDRVQRLPCGAPTFNPDCASPDSPLRGQWPRQGLGYFEQTQGDTYGINLDTTKSFHFLGGHSVTFGYRFERSHYDGVKERTGARFIPPTTKLNGASANNYGLTDPALISQLFSFGTNATFQLRASQARCIDQQANIANASELYVSGLDAAQIVGGNDMCADGGIGVRLRQTRGEFGTPVFTTQGDYHTLFAQDSWNLNKYVTINAGLRWEQQRVAGVNAAYTFTDNWSPRVGITIDPWGNRKTKIFANFGRYNENLPLDIAIRSLSAEFDAADVYWLPATDGAGHVVVSPNGEIQPNTAAGIIAQNAGAAAQSAVAFAPGTRMQYLDEYVVGLEHEFGNSGVIFTARYTDRRIKRIVEDMAALSPEAADTGLTQQYLIGNPSKTLDVFTNPQQVGFVGAFDAAGNFTNIPAACDPNFAAQVTDSNGNVAFDPNGNDSVCISNSAVAGNPAADGIVDGFVDPVRIYKSMEFEVNKSYSKGWQLRANYRIAKLFGNYEGSFRNDNGQSDPNISSLFDFTRGDWNLLGQQFTPGVLNTDVRHLVNGYVSYTFGNKWMKGLTLGSSAHFQTGTPINNLFAHPVYANAGEIPFCADDTTNCASARGALGRTHNWGQVDFSADYPIRLTEKTRLHLNAALFNVTDMRTQLRVNEFKQLTVGVGNADFQKPTQAVGNADTVNPGYQRPFYARFGVKLEF